MMQGLRLKQKALDVKAKVFRRRSSTMDQMPQMEDTRDRRKVRTAMGEAEVEASERRNPSPPVSVDSGNRSVRSKVSGLFGHVRRHHEPESPREEGAPRERHHHHHGHHQRQHTPNSQLGPPTMNGRRSSVATEFVIVNGNGSGGQSAASSSKRQSGTSSMSAAVFEYGDGGSVFGVGEASGAGAVDGCDGFPPTEAPKEAPKEAPAPAPASLTEPGCESRPDPIPAAAPAPLQQAEHPPSRQIDAISGDKNLEDHQLDPGVSFRPAPLAPLAPSHSPSPSPSPSPTKPLYYSAAPQQQPHLPATTTGTSTNTSSNSTTTTATSATASTIPAPAAATPSANYSQQQPASTTPTPTPPPHPHPPPPPLDPPCSARQQPQSLVSTSPIPAPPPPAALHPSLAPLPETEIPTATTTTTTPSSAPSFTPIRFGSLRSDTTRGGRSSPIPNPIVQSVVAESVHDRRPSQIIRRQSVFPPNQPNFIKELYFAQDQNTPDGGPHSSQTPQQTMATRKIWVKRANGSPTAVQVGEVEMVDDVRDLILAKYQNTLGRYYDAPDIQIHIQPRPGRSRMERGHGERMLNPDEILFHVIDEYYPGGQAAEDALIIVTDGRRTPRPSPGHAQSYTYGEGHMPQEMPDYFGQTGSGGSQGTPVGNAQTASALSVVIGQLSPVPRSPGGRSRPRIGPRMNTASPTLLGGASAGTHGAHVAHAGHPSHPSHVGHVAHSTHTTHSNHSVHSSHPTHVSHVAHSTHNTHNSHPHPQGPVVLVPRGPRPRVGSDASNGGQPPVPTPLKAPAPEEITQKDVVPSPVRVGSPPATTKPFKKDKNPKPVPPSPAAALHSDGAVPPIKVLIVEDNVINLRLLEAFMKRLKVRWEAAVNGKIAVDKWRAGGFHLVLMDIQLPVMNGLEATKEIRRLEKVNRIRGAFPHTANRPDSEDEEEELLPKEIPEADRLPDSILFRSPVIIVALTASSLVSDRHEAYAAGCNDFLTKPVNFIWLERKVTEWGCMQALIDFDGWKTWKKSAEEMTAQDATNAKNKRLAAGNKPGKKTGKGLLEEKK